MTIQRPESDYAIPSSAKCVFKGKIFDVYQWEVEGYDGKKKTWEKLKRADTIFVLPVTDDKKIVIAKEEQPGKSPYFSCLGGRAEEGESALETAQRELKEETGGEAKSWSLLLAHQVTIKIDWAMFIFIARDFEITAEQELDGGEKIELLYLDFDQFEEMVLTNQLNNIYLKNFLLEAKLDASKMKAFKEMVGIA